MQANREELGGGDYLLAEDQGCGQTVGTLDLQQSPDILCTDMTALPWALAVGQGQLPASIGHEGITPESKTQATRVAMWGAP